jgi:hypothetical protein
MFIIFIQNGRGLLPLAAFALWIVPTTRLVIIAGARSHVPRAMTRISRPSALMSWRRPGRRPGVVFRAASARRRLDDAAEALAEVRQGTHGATVVLQPG